MAFKRVDMNVVREMLIPSSLKMSRCLRRCKKRIDGG